MISSMGLVCFIDDKILNNVDEAINRGCYMSAYVLLNLLNKFYLFFATSLINSIIQEHKC